MPEDILETILSYINPVEKTLNEHIDIISRNGLEKFVIQNLNQNYVNDENVNRIFSYVQNLNKKEKDKILCEYGLAKGLQLFYNFHRHIGYSYSDICEFFELHDFPIENDIIVIIFMREFGIFSDEN